MFDPVPCASPARRCPCASSAICASLHSTPAARAHAMTSAASVSVAARTSKKSAGVATRAGGGSSSPSCVDGDCAGRGAGRRVASRRLEDDGADCSSRSILRRATARVGDALARDARRASGTRAGRARRTRTSSRRRSPSRLRRHRVRAPHDTWTFVPNGMRAARAASLAKPIRISPGRGRAEQPRKRPGLRYGAVTASDMSVSSHRSGRSGSSRSEVRLASRPPRRPTRASPHRTEQRL